MSNECLTLVQKRAVGSSTKKAVLVYLADRASDDGSGIWTSKSHIAMDTELSKRAVQKSMSDMEDAGLIVKVGTRKCKNGFTYEYAIILPAIMLLESTRPTDELGSPVQHVHPIGEGGSPDRCSTFTPRGEGGSPKPSINHSLTTQRARRV